MLPTTKNADPVEIPRRHLPWFTQMMMAFAAIVLAVLVYGFWRMARAPMPSLDVPAQEQVGPATAPASPPPARP